MGVAELCWSGRSRLILAAWLIAGGAAVAGTPSLTPLTAAEQAQQTQAVQDFDKADWAAALPIFTRLAALGDARSETDLGRMYYYGWAVGRDQDEAFYLISQAAAQNYSPAEDKLGRMYLVAGIDDKAVSWFQHAAQAGNADGEDDLADAYRFGNGISIDDAQALRWYAAAAAQGNDDANISLGNMYQNGEGVAQDNGKAMRYFKVAAARGDAAALFDIGWMYETGAGVTQDYHEAMLYYEQSASDGFASADTNMSHLYENGLGVPQSDAVAFAWTTKAALTGDAGGEYDLGWSFEHGKGTPVDIARAAHWYELSAEQGDADSEYALGQFYLKGEGVEQNDAQAANLFQAAADQGDTLSQVSLGLLYLDGNGVSRNANTAMQFFNAAAAGGNVDGEEDAGWSLRDDGHYAEALPYFVKAAAAGDPAAQVNLGYMYEAGEGVKQDFATDLKWALITLSMMKYTRPNFEYDRANIEDRATVHMNIDFAHLNRNQVQMAASAAQTWLSARGIEFDRSLIPPPPAPAWPGYAEAVVGILLGYALLKSIQVRKRK